MNKNELWLLYKWVITHLSSEERKLIMANDPDLLKSTKAEYGIHLDAKIARIVKQSCNE